MGISSTRSASRHKRDRRRAETEQLRIARRKAVAALLSRARRGELNAAEAALLAAHFEAEIAEGDAARASERGQSRAAERHREVVEAADVAIREAEETLEEHRAALSEALGLGNGAPWEAIHARAAERPAAGRPLWERLAMAHKALGRVRRMADAWEQRLPETILTATAVEAIRAAAANDDTPEPAEGPACAAVPGCDGQCCQGTWPAVTEPAPGAPHRGDVATQWTPGPVAVARAAETGRRLTSPAWRPDDGHDRCPTRQTFGPDVLQCTFRAGHPPHGCAFTPSNPGTPTDGPHCPCGAPIEMSGDPGQWIHSPGSDTPCTDARPALYPAMAPASTAKDGPRCAVCQTPIAEHLGWHCERKPLAYT
ncbi:hypothetical protein ABZ468_07610 [Streptomyces sp. NPDC005708]|uniref:hypothetical protein n=1 Tax=Streptomyces sp. NPDC005708 TaxID=3154564 RepID=UPI0033D0739E